MPGKLGQRGFGFLDDSGEGGLFVHCQIGQNLAVDLDGRLSQASNQTAVGQTVLTSTSVDTSDPQSAELAVALTAVKVGVMASIDPRLLGDAEHERTRSVAALGEHYNFLVTSTSDDATLNASHD